MTRQQFLTSAWTWNSAVLIAAAAALIAYVWAFGINHRIVYLLAGVGVFVLTLVSPLNALAAGYLFSAHMLQHILLLLIVPALVLMSLPPRVSLGSRSWVIANPLVGWIAGVGYPSAEAEQSFWNDTRDDFKMAQQKYTTDMRLYALEGVAQK